MILLPTYKSAPATLCLFRLTSRHTFMCGARCSLNISRGSWQVADPYEKPWSVRCQHRQTPPLPARICHDLRPGPQLRTKTFRDLAPHHANWFSYTLFSPALWLSWWHKEGDKILCRHYNPYRELQMDDLSLTRLKAATKKTTYGSASQFLREYLSRFSLHAQRPFC